MRRLNQANGSKVRVTVTDAETNKSKTQTYCDTTPEQVFDVLDRACEDAEQPEPAKSQ